MAPGKSPWIPFHVFLGGDLTFIKSSPGPTRESPPAVSGACSFWCEATQEHPVTSLSWDSAENVNINRSALRQQGWTFLCLRAAFSTTELGQFMGCASGVAQPSWLFPHSAGSLEENLGSGCRSQVLPSTGDRRQTSKDQEPLALPALHLMLSFTEVLIIFWGRASPQPQGFGETQLCSQSRQCSFTQPHPVNVCNACNPHSELLGMILWDISRIR